MKAELTYCIDCEVTIWNYEIARWGCCIECYINRLKRGIEL